MTARLHSEGIVTRDITTLAATPMTAEELARLSIPDKSVELVRGQLVVREPPGTRQGDLAGRLYLRVATFVEAHALGVAYPQDTGFRIRTDPDTVRAPDVAFVARERVHLVPPTGYAPLAPDLVAEILSPDDRPGEVLAKVADWLEAGTRLVWVVDPRRSEAHVHRLDGSLSVVGVDDALDGEQVLPGFSCRLREVLG